MPKPTDPQKWSHMFTDDIKFTQKIVLMHPEDRDRFLVLKRSLHAKVRPGATDVPGGNVIYGENALDAIYREVQEETGIIDIPEPQTIHIRAIMREEKGYYLLAVGYKSQLSRGHLEQIILSNEHTEYEWMNKVEFLALDQHWFLKELVEKV